MAPASIVEIESLSHRFGDRVALDAVTFSIPPRTIFALLGPNGGGKTTLFRVLATLLTPTAGSARVAGSDVVVHRPAVRKCIGVVFQKPALDVKLTVAENLRTQGGLYGLAGGVLRDRSRDSLERFGLSDRTRERVEKLSGGLQRRLEIAKAMLHRPQVLILDEPSTGLDPAARLTLMTHLRELRDRDGVTSLLTTHLMDEADRCDIVGVIDRGRLLALDTPAALKSSVGGDVMMIACSDAESLAAGIRERFGGRVSVVDGLIHFERDRGHEFVSTLIEAFPGEIDSVTVGKPTLENVFMQLTGRRL